MRTPEACQEISRGLRSLNPRLIYLHASGVRRRLKFNLKPHCTDAVVFAVANVKRTALDKYAVRSCQFALERIAVRAVPALAGTDYSRDCSIPKIDSANDVAFCVGYVKGTLCGIRDSFGAV